MKNLLTQAAGIGLATTIALAVQSSAQAYEFSFSGFTAGSHSASGTFRINNSTPEGNITAADFEDWEIEFSDGDAGNGNPDLTLYGPGGSFGTANSSFFPNTSIPNTATFDSGNLSFTTSWLIKEDGGFSNYIYQSTQDNNNYLVLDSAVGINPGVFPADFLTAAATSPTPVPFGASTDLSILILGGLFGASRLRRVY